MEGRAKRERKKAAVGRGRGLGVGRRLQGGRRQGLRKVGSPEGVPEAGWCRWGALHLVLCYLLLDSSPLA